MKIDEPSSQNYSSHQNCKCISLFKKGNAIVNGTCYSSFVHNSTKMSQLYVNGNMYIFREKLDTNIEDIVIEHFKETLNYLFYLIKVQNCKAS